MIYEITGTMLTNTFKQYDTDGLDSDCMLTDKSLVGTFCLAKFLAA